MTYNPFHSNELLKSISNYPVKKGDTPGHPFHGNQYTDAPFSSTIGGVEGARTIGEASKQLNEHVHKEPLRAGFDEEGMHSTVYHDGAAMAHERIAEALEKVGTPASLSAASAHRDAQKAHEAAQEIIEDTGSTATDIPDNYYEVAENAQRLTDVADRITRGETDSGEQSPPQ